MRISGRGNYKYEEGAGICFATSLQIHLFSVVILSFLQPEVIADFLERLFSFGVQQTPSQSISCGLLITKKWIWWLSYSNG